MDIFERIVCGVDGTRESDAAIAQAVQLSSSETALMLVHIFTITPIDETGLILGEVWQPEEEHARDLLERAKSWVIESGGLDASCVDSRVAPGPKARGLLEVADRTDATLLCVGCHGHSRLGGAIRGSVVSNALHSARCSVLIAREPDASATGTTGTIAGEIVCGVDGSPESARAASVAEEVSRRTGCAVRFVAAEDGDSVSFTNASHATPTQGDLSIEPGRPMDVLLAQSRGADMLVVGSRGLGGARAIGSVSERLAHEAACSVLVVRSDVN